MGVDIPGTGVIIGVDRLLFAMMQLNQIEVDTQNPVIVCVMDEKYLKNYYEILDNLRKNNINSEIFLDSKKNLGKQLTYANKRDCPVAIICGENEFNENTVTIKNLKGVKGENNKTFPRVSAPDEYFIFCSNLREVYIISLSSFFSSLDPKISNPIWFLIIESFLFRDFRYA